MIHHRRKILKRLGIDMGERRIGLAVSDPLGITAQGIKTIQVKEADEIPHKLTEIIRETNAQKLVFGLPRNMNGSLGPQTRKVQEIGRKLQALSKLPVEYEDERLSTASAEKVLLLADQSRAKRKKAIDRLSAVIILQSYLDRKASERNEGIC